MIEIELLGEPQLDLLTLKEVEFSEASKQIEELKAQMALMTEDQDVMKGENNSLKKKVQSLQTDYEKLSRKVSTTQARSSGGNSDEPYGSQVDNKTNHQASSVNVGMKQIASAGEEVDLHN